MRSSTRSPDGVSQENSQIECSIETPFMAVPTVPAGYCSRWQTRPANYKKIQIQQKKGRRQRNRDAISLLTVSLPPELRGHGIRPLNEAIRRLSWWEGRERTDVSQHSKLYVYREIQREWQSLLKS